MRFVAAVALLFAASTAVAQPYVGEEVRSWTMERGVSVSNAPSPAVALLSDHGSLVLAWSSGLAQSRVSVAKLDGSLRVIDGTQRELPTHFGDGFDADAPQLAVTTDGYALSWLERKRLGVREPVHVIVSRLSRSFDVESQIDVVPVSPDVRIRLGSRGDDILVVADPVIYTIAANGTTTFNSPHANGTLDDAAITPQHVALVSHTFIPGSSGGFCCIGTPPKYDGRVYIDSVVAEGLTLQDGTQQAAIGINGDGASTFLVTWARTNGQIVAVHEASPAKPYPESLASPLPLGTWSEGAPYKSVPSSASDGEHWLVVWPSHGNIEGSAIDSHVRPFFVSASADDEERPIVVNVGPGVFLVAYEIGVDFDHKQLAGRYVTFLPPHHRPGAK